MECNKDNCPYRPDFVRTTKRNQELKAENENLRIKLKKCQEQLEHLVELAKKAGVLEE